MKNKYMIQLITEKRDGKMKTARILKGPVIPQAARALTRLGSKICKNVLRRFELYFP